MSEGIVTITDKRLLFNFLIFHFLKNVFMHLLTIIRTLMELGISPIVTSSMLVQLLVGSQLIEVNMELKSDREMYQLVQKCMFDFQSTVVCSVAAFSYIFNFAHFQF